MEMGGGVKRGEREMESESERGKSEGKSARARSRVSCISQLHGVLLLSVPRTGDMELLTSKFAFAKHAHAFAARVELLIKEESFAARKISAKFMTSFPAWTLSRG